MMWLIRNNFYSRQISKFLKFNWVPLSLTFMSLWDIRYEIRLLVENFTFTGLFFAIYNHPLAIAVIILMPKIKASSSK